MGEHELPISDPALERRMRAEIRREMEAAEAEGRTLAARQSTMREVLAVCVQRGDQVTVATGSVRMRGIPRYVRGDLLSLQTGAAMIECQLPVLDEITIDDSGPNDGAPIVHEAESFAARMGLIELSGETIEIITVAGLRISGTIGALGRDHVAVVGTAGRRSLVPVSRVAFVVRGFD